jgi:hypothetical protein
MSPTAPQRALKPRKVPDIPYGGFSFSILEWNYGFLCKNSDLR